MIQVLSGERDQFENRFSHLLEATFSDALTCFLTQHRIQLPQLLTGAPSLRSSPSPTAPPEESPQTSGTGNRKPTDEDGDHLQCQPGGHRGQ